MPSFPGRLVRGRPVVRLVRGVRERPVAGSIGSTMMPVSLSLVASSSSSAGPDPPIGGHGPGGTLDVPCAVGDAGGRPGWGYVLRSGGGMLRSCGASARVMSSCACVDVVRLVRVGGADPVDGRYERSVAGDLAVGSSSAGASSEPGARRRPARARRGRGHAGRRRGRAVTQDPLHDPDGQEDAAEHGGDARRARPDPRTPRSPSAGRPCWSAPPARAGPCRRPALRRRAPACPWSPRGVRVPGRSTASGRSSGVSAAPTAKAAPATSSSDCTAPGERTSVRTARPSSTRPPPAIRRPTASHRATAARYGPRARRRGRRWRRRTRWRRHPTGGPACPPAAPAGARGRGPRR